MRLLTNPLVLRMAIVFFSAAVAFIVGLIAIRQMRRSVQEDAALGDAKNFTDSLPLHTYHAVIQQLKQQKSELQAAQQAERRRAKATENISAAVLSNLSSAVLFFNSQGIIRQANPAAKTILGFASPVGMNAQELFRDATVRGGLNSERTPLAEAVTVSLKNLSKFHGLEADYRTPAGENRVVEVTISPVYSANADVLGAACLINDQTEIAEMRRTHETGGGLSEEQAVLVRDSIAAVRDHVQSLTTARDEQQLAQLAAAIASETEQLENKLSKLWAKTAVGTASGMD